MTNFVWHELHTPNATVGETFYRAVTGWNIF